MNWILDNIIAIVSMLSTAIVAIVGFIIFIKLSINEHKTAIETLKANDHELNENLKSIEKEIQENREIRIENKGTIQATHNSVEELKYDFKKLLKTLSESALVDQEQSLKIAQHERDISEIKEKLKGK